MKGDMNQRKKECLKCGKIAFTKKDAQTKKNYLLKRGAEKYLRIYQCGDYWHLTSQKPDKYL